jgi:hypothetical protein
MRTFVLVAATYFAASPLLLGEEITRVWLSHKTNDPSKLVVNWESNTAGNAVVEYGLFGGQPQRAEVVENATLHHVEIPLTERNAVYRYTVRTGDDRSAEATFKAYPTDELRIAVVADWHSKTKLPGLERDDVHLLLTAGDNIPSLHHRCGPGVTDCTKPYSELIDAYPHLFRSTIFLPALGNHDREIRLRGAVPPPEEVYDVEAAAFRTFFELPGDEWKWHFDIPEFDLRLIALDLNHIQDLGTTWQTCHPYAKDSEQFRWYQKLMESEGPGRVVTLHNEKSGSMRSREDGAWHKLFRRGSCTITGFGYFAERAEYDGHTYYNTALGAGAKYRDSHAQFFEAVPSYVLITVTKTTMAVELKSLEGAVLDRKEFGANVE